MNPLLPLLLLCALAQSAESPKPMTWTVGADRREALVYIPASTTKAPVIFAFHGHGGTMKFAAEKFAYHQLWPEAICVYPQGLNTPGMTDPAGVKPGWQKSVGDQNDRDLKFFDAMLETLKREQKVDPERIFATGHSNGGGFTYLLWAARGDTFAAVAPCAAVALRQLKDLKPKPCLHLAGEKDPIVQYDWQKRMIEGVRKVNGCETEGKPWQNAGVLTGTLYASKTPLVTLIHPNGHELPKEAHPLIVKFFKESTTSAIKP